MPDHPATSSNLSLRTSDTTLLTQFGPDDLSASFNLDRSFNSIDSLLKFIEYYFRVPGAEPHDLYDEGTTAGLLVSDRAVNIIGKGLSFIVQAERDYNVPTNLFFPHQIARPAVVAVKAPRIERNEFVELDTVEARCLRAIAWEWHVNLHPLIRECKNIIGVYGLTWRHAFAGRGGIRRLLPALVMELATEGPLSDLNSDKYCLSYATKWKLALDVAWGLKTLHNHGIVNGDVKAQNVLLSLDADGELVAKVADFACSIKNYGRQEAERLPGRSPPWDAPEVRRGPIELSKLHKTDIYSFGLLVWTLMLDGRCPFDEPGVSQLNPDFEDIQVISNKEERLTAIQSLKDRTDDLLLSRIKRSLAERGLHEGQLSKMFDLTVRHDENKRVETMTRLLAIFEASDLDIPGGDSNDTLNKEKDDTVPMYHNVSSQGHRFIS